MMKLHLSPAKAGADGLAGDYGLGMRASGT